MRAFPAVHDKHFQSGMELRDYFAAKAMQGFLTEKYTDAPSEKIVEWSYDIADAMMKQREEKEHG